MFNYLLYILLILNSKSPQISAFLQPTRNITSKLPKFICNAVDEISQQEVRTIAILEMENNFSSGFFDELYLCMSTDVSMVQMDLKNAIDNVDLKSIKFVVVLGDKIDWVRIKLK